MADRIHENFIIFPNERVFKYSSVLFHMFLYLQSDKFPVRIQKLETKGHPRTVIFCTQLMQIYSIAFSYKEFIDSFFHPIIIMLTNIYQPRINEEIKKVLQLAKNNRVGD